MDENTPQKRDGKTVNEVLLITLTCTDPAHDPKYKPLIDTVMANAKFNATALGVG